MQLKSIELRQFRNYRREVFRFSPAVNMVCGRNGAGKSNLLEACAVALWNCSPRTRNLRECIQWGKEGFLLRAVIEYQNHEQELESRYRLSGERELRINAKIFTGPLRDIWLRYPLVLFSPGDLLLVSGEPVLRRRFLNSVLVATDKEYSVALVRYHHTVRERNACLQRMRASGGEPGVLQAFDEQLVVHGVRIARRRQHMLNRLLPAVVRYAHQLSGGTMAVSGEYRSGIIPSPPVPGDEQCWEECFRRRLKDVRSAEVQEGKTLLGPQRDDLLLAVRQHPARSFASRGQQRLLVVALKLAARDYISSRNGEPALLLFDDLFSELDAGYQHLLWQFFDGTGQAFLTSTVRPEASAVPPIALQELSAAVAR